jgi:hypothetical protein
MRLFLPPVAFKPIAFGSFRRWPLTPARPFAECQLKTLQMVSRERWANSERSMAALLGYKVVPRNEPRLRQRISAQSQPRFCTPIFRPGLPCPQEAGPSPQAPLSAVRRLGVAPTPRQSFRRPFGYRGLSSASGLAPSAPTASDPAYPRPAESPPGRYHGFCASPERPPPGAPRTGPRAGKGWCE